VAPGVQAGSGSPPWLMQPEVFVRADGAQLLVDAADVGAAGTMTMSVDTAEATGGSVGAGVAVDAVVAGTRAAAGVHAPRTSAVARSVHRTTAGVALGRMEVIGVTSGRPPSVDRPEGSKALFLIFDGLRDARVRDRDTRIRIALQGPQAVRLWRLLGERLTDEEKAANQP
jgi:hypothetical protein